MKRVASLDFLRGLAAFSVAIPHYLTLNVADSALADAIAITSVEVFFVLSGFVLAPQILTMVVGGPTQNLRTFIIRRWMRTIPPYLIALIFIAIITGELFTPDLVRYVFYIQNLFSQANINDFFPVAWSLSVEEWFYITFAPLLFVLAKLFDRKDGAFAAKFAICFILLILVARYFGDYGNWDAAVRRVTIFRIDSIAWGFFLFIATKRVAPFEIGTSKGRMLLGASLGLFLACGFLAVVTAYHTSGSALSRQAFPFAAAAFGISAVFLFRQAEFLFVGNSARIGIFLGHISYSVYLFHLLVAMTIKPALTGLDITLQIAIFVGLLVCLTSVIWLYIEKPILAARPKYDRGETSFHQTVDNAPYAAPHSLVAAGASAIFVFAFSFYCFVAYQGNHQRTFYLTFIAAGASVLVAASRIAIPGITSVFLTLFFFTILLPPADYIFRKSNAAVFVSTSAVASLPSSSPTQIKPAYSFKSGKTDPEAFHAWWAHYVDEWLKLGGGNGATQKTDPKGLLPFVLIPNSTARFFDSVIRINSLGFRGVDFERDKRNKFRIFALGESPTFGPTLHAGDRTWPEYLQGLIDTELTCNRPIEIINAGTQAYTLANNVERLERDIVPLNPDLVISYHGYNGLGVLFGNAPFSNTIQEPHRIENRPSALLNEISYRARIMIFRFGSQKVFPIYTEDQIMDTEYANSYRTLLRIAHDNGFRVILASSSMAVGPSSPSEVKAFYGVVFGGIEEMIIRNAAHNEMVRKIAADENVPFIDTVPHLDGLWDDDLYLDLAHFTQAGNKKMAKIVFDGLTDALRKDPQLKCSDRK